MRLKVDADGYLFFLLNNLYRQVKTPTFVPSFANGLKRYQQIAHTLRQQIIGGQHATGTLLPSENELCTQFDTTRMTVRQALGELVREGFIDRQQGRGSVVKADRQSLGLLSFRGFSEVVGGSNHSAHNEFLERPTHTDWPDPFFRSLSPNELAGGCVFLKRLRFANDTPVMIEQTYLPSPGLTDLLTEGLIEGSLFRTMSIRHRIDILDMEQSLRAVMASPEQEAVFRCASSTPLLYIERRYQTNRPDFYVYSQLYCHTEKYAVSNF